MNGAPAITLDYPIVQQTLDNGLRVISSPDHVAPSVAVNLWYDVGSRDEEAGRTGFAHLFEHIMFQGSAQVASGQHIALLQAAGASVNATTWFDRTNYFETLPTGGLDLALWLEADRLGTLLDALTQESLDNQREVVKEERRQRYDNVPYGDATELLTALTFPPDHPYGHTTIGSMEDLDAATLADVQSFFRTHYLPNNAVLSIVGDVDAGRRLRAGRDLLRAPAQRPQTRQARRPATSAADRSGTGRGLRSGPGRGRLPHLAASRPGHPGLRCARPRVHHPRARPDLPAAQGHWSAGPNGPRRPAASALGLIGGNSSGLVYARARDGVPVEQLEADLLAEVERLQSAPPTEMELRRAKAQYQRHWLHELVRLDSRADALGEYATLHGDPNLINTRIAEINAVSLDDIADVLPRWFGVDQRATLIYRRESPVSGLVPQPKLAPPGVVALPDPHPGPARQRHRDRGLPAARASTSISANLVLPIPLNAEDRATEGMATICARVLDEGSRQHDGEEFAELLETEGAGFGVELSLAGLQAVLDVPAPHLEPALRLFAEAVREPTLAERDVNRHVQLRLAEIEQALANSAQSASIAFRARGLRRCQPRLANERRRTGDGEPDRPRGRRRLPPRPVRPEPGHLDHGRGLQHRPGRHGQPVPRRLGEPPTSRSWSPRCRRPPPGGCCWWTARARYRPTSATARSASTGWTPGGPTSPSPATRWVGRSCPGSTPCCARTRATPTAYG